MVEVDVPEAILEGVEYVLEMVNFMSFIALESLKFALFAGSTCLDTGRYDIAQYMVDTQMSNAYMEIWGWQVMYGIGFTPSWKAFIAFWWMGRLSVEQFKRDFSEVKDMTKLGYYKDSKGKWTNGVDVINDTTWNDAWKAQEK